MKEKRHALTSTAPDGHVAVWEECGKNIFFVGIFRGSVGPSGDSDGEFMNCKTTQPFSELGFTTINGVKTAPWQ